MTSIVDDYDQKLAGKDEIIRLREGELKRKDTLLKLHKNKKKREGPAQPEGAWRLVIDELAARQVHLENEILRLRGDAEASEESVAEC